MTVDWTYFRDQIAVNDALKNEITTEINFRKLAPGSILLITARNIKHDANYILRLEGYNLVLVADQYDAAGGAIDVSGHDGTDGQPGTNGAAGYASAGGASDRPGGPGGKGQDGRPGTNGMNVTLFCRQLLNAHLISKGGQGGSGGTGGGGGKGGDGRSPGRHIEGWEGTAGGTGGNGGNGAHGGNGGHATVFYVEGANTLLDVSGGAGGKSGPAGVGGLNGNLAGADGQRAAAGHGGAAGGRGNYSEPVSLQVGESDFWNRVQTELGPKASAWGDYRLRVGEYYFRAFTPNNPEKIDYLGRALWEFDAVLSLNPSNVQAQTYRKHLIANQNILGMANDYDIIPTFREYEQFVVDYAPWVTEFFGYARSMLLADIDLKEKLQDLENAQARIAESVQVFTIEQKRAQLAIQDATDQLDDVDQRIKINENSIQALESFLSTLNYIDENGELLGTLWDVTKVLLLLEGGAAYVLMIDLVKGYWSHMSDDKLVGKVPSDIQNLTGGMKDLINQSKDFISYTQTMGDINKSQIEQKYKDLLTRRAELVFERARKQLTLDQAELEKQAWDLRIQNAQKDSDQAQNEKDNISKDIAFMGETVRTLIRGAQVYVNIILKYFFWAARALDIFTLSDETSKVPFDIGYIHPDHEEDAYLALSRGDASGVLSLINEYTDSWSRLPAIMLYRDQYETYITSLSSDMQFWHYKSAELQPAPAPIPTPPIKRPLRPDHRKVIIVWMGESHTPSPAPTIDQFRVTADFDFSIALDELLDNRFEVKIDTVYVSLIGATASDPYITCLLEHSGLASIRRQDGTIAQVTAPAKWASVTAAKTAGEFGGVQEDPLQHLSFWGRSPAARWRLYIEPQVLQRSNVDLSGLSEIQIAITYRSINRYPI